MRLDKFLADAGIGTRSEVKNVIRKKQVTVNALVVTDPGMAVTESDEIRYRSEPVRASKLRYFMMHKPAGCVCATKDDERTVLDYFPEKERRKLFPVGRLDKDTEGLLLLTDDGMFAHNLTSPRKHVEKTYYFEAEGLLARDTEEQIAAGVDIGDEKPTGPAVLELLTEDMKRQSVSGYLTISEGRYHQVKRMLAKMGVAVTYLKRISIGKVVLDQALEKGQYRPLTKEEYDVLTSGGKK